MRLVASYVALLTSERGLDHDPNFPAPTSLTIKILGGKWKDILSDHLSAL